MFAYLNKKITIPNCPRLRSIAWNHEGGWLACGGEGNQQNGLLKILKLDHGPNSTKTTGGSTLSSNLTLDGHERGVHIGAWNEQYRKLATADENGNITMWTLHRNSWFDELSTNRKASRVRDVVWNGDGTRILFAYEDGVLTVGTVEGERVWITETGRSTTHTSWSPDGRALLVGSSTGEVSLHDAMSNGAYLSRVRIQCVEEYQPQPQQQNNQQGGGEGGNNNEAGARTANNNNNNNNNNTGNTLAAVLWHPGSIEHCGEVVPSIAIIYENGRFQLMTSVQDENPIISDIQMKAVAARWNPAGTILAIAGIPAPGGQQGNNNNAAAQADKHVYIHFFSCRGKLLRILRIPGAFCGGITWESNGLRLAAAIDSCVYFANVRPEYRWGYFNKTIVYAYAKKERAERCVMFWNTKTNEKNIKYVRNLMHIAACEDLCVLVSKPADVNSQSLIQQQQSSSSGGATAAAGGGGGSHHGGVSHHQAIVTICDAVASPVEVKHVDFEPHSSLMGQNHVVIAGDEMIWIWQFRSPDMTSSSSSSSSSSSHSTVLDPITLNAMRKDNYERYIHVDELISGSVTGSNVVKRGLTTDYICCICTQGDLLFVMRQSGILLIYTLHPTFALVSRLSTGLRCNQISVNCNSSLIACIDNSTILNMFKIHHGTFSIVQSIAEPVPDFERKDCWNILFADDDPDTFCTMEKARMYIFRKFEPEEPVNCSVCVNNFTALKVRGFALDDVLSDAEHPVKDQVVEFETKSLRDTRELLKTSGLKETFAYVLDHPHTRLWSLIVEAALEKQDFSLAERAVVRCRDYPAIHFVKRVKALDDPQKQRAEVAAYYQKFDEAEKIYKGMDRKDLALELRARLGDWFRVVQLVQEGGGDEALVIRAWENIGDFYAERQKWTKAAQYYTQCKNYSKLAKALYTLEDFRGLEKIVDKVTHDRNLLLRIAEMFLSVGLVEAAVAAFLKAGEPRRAVDSCIHLHQWDQAVVLAEKNNLPEVNSYLSKYASHLVESGRIAQAIELYKKANQNHEAAKLLSKLGQQAASQQQPVKAKKFFVLAALEVETQRRRQLLGSQSAAQLADQLLASDSAGVGDKSLDNAWHGAEAYHYFMMCQQHLFNKNMDAALSIAVRLMEYDDVISTLDAYSLVALTSYFAKSFGMCSKAFTRLEALEIDNEMLSNNSTGGGGGGGGKSSSSSSSKKDEKLSSSTSAASSSSGHDELEFDLDIATSKFANSGVASGTGVSSALSADSSSSSSSGANGLDGGISSSVIASGKPRKFAELAVRIFTQHPPSDASVDKTKCFKCGAFNKDWASQCQKCSVAFSPCIITGKAVMPTTGWQCRTCRHRALESEIRRYKNCPLCHATRKEDEL